MSSVSSWSEDLVAVDEADLDGEAEDIEDGHTKANALKLNAAHASRIDSVEDFKETIEE